jgi:metallophosphoesterase superfamily enzyme
VSEVPELYAHPSGALWIPEIQALLAADLHLGYGWAQRRRGEAGPVSDAGTAERLLTAVGQLKPKTVVLLGDVYHAPRPAPDEATMIRSLLNQLPGLVVVRGNHDRAIWRDFGIPASFEWHARGLVAIHGDLPLETSQLVVMGHLHPVVRLRDGAGVWHRVPVFLSEEKRIVLPAFSPFSTGWPVRKRKGVYAATGRQIHPLWPHPDMARPDETGLLRIR